MQGQIRNTLPARCIDPLLRPPEVVWYQDMADFAESISSDQAGQRLARAELSDGSPTTN